MKVLIPLIALIILTPDVIIAQTYSTARAELIKTEKTGKRHQSYFFTFRIKEHLSGATQDTVVTSQEIYWDFGAKQLLSKAYTNRFFKEGPKVPQEVVIKYSCDTTSFDSLAKWYPDQTFTGCYIKWVAEPYRIKSFESLEERLTQVLDSSYFYFSENFLLKEIDGKLFFSENGQIKAAVEAYPGSRMWYIMRAEDQ